MTHTVCGYYPKTRKPFCEEVCAASAAVAAELMLASEPPGDVVVTGVFAGRLTNLAPPSSLPVRTVTAERVGRVSVPLSNGSAAIGLHRLDGGPVVGLDEGYLGHFEIEPVSPYDSCVKIVLPNKEGEVPLQIAASHMLVIDGRMVRVVGPFTDPGERDREIRKINANRREHAYWLDVDDRGEPMVGILDGHAPTPLTDTTAGLTVRVADSEMAFVSGYRQVASVDWSPSTNTVGEDDDVFCNGILWKASGGTNRVRAVLMWDISRLAGRPAHGSQHMVRLSDLAWYTPARGVTEIPVEL